MRRDVSGSVSVADTPRVVAAMVVEANAGLVLGTAMAADEAGALGEAFAIALTKPPGLPPMGPPALVLCPHGMATEVAGALRTLIGPGDLPPIRQQEPVPGAEDIFDALVGHLAGRGPAGDPPEPEDWAAAVAAAHQLRSQSPWDRWDDTVPLDVELHAATDGAARFRCVVIGAAGEQRGLVLFPGDGWPPGFGPGDGSPARPPVGTLMLFFDPPDELPHELVARAHRYGWPAEDDLVPLFSAVGDGGPVEADRDQVRRLTVAATAVAAHDRRGPIAMDGDRATTGTLALGDGEDVAFSLTMGSPSPAGAPGGRTSAGEPAPSGAVAQAARGRRTTTGEATIDVLLHAFLDEQRRRLSPKTVRSCEEVVDLLVACLEGYGHQSLDADERARWEAAREDDEHAFVHLFGADKIVDNLGEFLGYFMLRKVMASRGMLRSAGTVTKKLVRWLGDHGHISPGDARAAATTTTRAARDLPRADELSELLWQHSQATGSDPSLAPGSGVDEGMFTIERVEPGALWFDGGRGPVPVPRAASDLAQPGWSLTGTLLHHGQHWHLVEMGTVYP